MQQTIFVHIVLFFHGLFSGLVFTQILTNAIFVTLLAVSKPNEALIILQEVNIDMLNIFANPNIEEDIRRSSRNNEERGGEQ